MKHRNSDVFRVPIESATPYRGSHINFTSEAPRISPINNPRELTRPRVSKNIRETHVAMGHAGTLKGAQCLSRNIRHVSGVLAPHGDMMQRDSRKRTEEQPSSASIEHLWSRDNADQRQLAQESGRPIIGTNICSGAGSRAHAVHWLMHTHGFPRGESRPQSTWVGDRTIAHEQ